MHWKECIMILKDNHYYFKDKIDLEEGVDIRNCLGEGIV